MTVGYLLGIVDTLRTFAVLGGWILVGWCTLIAVVGAEVCGVCSSVEGAGLESLLFELMAFRNLLPLM